MPLTSLPVNADRQQDVLVRLESAGRKVEGKWLIRDVSLKISRGEIVTLIGPNGSGKSTTARMILGLDVPSEGKAEVRPGTIAGYVPQKLTIDWTLPLRVDRFMSLTNKLTQHDIHDALEMVGSLKNVKSQIRNLSGGEFQRVLLARAIARKPDLLVLDEPVQGVDFSGELALYNLISNIRDELNCGVLLISHDLHVVMASTDHVVCLNGHICCQGAPTEVVNSSEYRDLFGQRALSTIAIYEHKHDHAHLPDGRITREGVSGQGNDQSERG